MTLTALEMYMTWNTTLVVWYCNDNDKCENIVVLNFVQYNKKLYQIYSVYFDVYCMLSHKIINE